MVKFGHQLIARAIERAGVRVAVGYPGFPCIEIVNNLANSEVTYAEWSTNEKVALEVAIGASFNGRRAVAVMKTVGLNVAADPFVAISGAKINGGLVVIVCDDVGRLAGDDLSDSREYAKYLDVPLFVPTDALNASELLPLALEMSEECNTVVLFRLTATITHTILNVDGTETKGDDGLAIGLPSGRYQYFPKTINATFYEIDRASKLFSEVREGYVDYVDRRERISDFVSRKGIYGKSLKSRKLGFICSGVAEGLVRDLYPNASTLTPYVEVPLLSGEIGRFLGEVEHVFVLEESKRLLEAAIVMEGLGVSNDENFLKRDSRIFRLSQGAISEAVRGFFKPEKKVSPKTAPASVIPDRIPVLCSGCSHRNVFFVLKEQGFSVIGDSGCFALSLFPPLESIDVFVSMGTSCGILHGVNRLGAPSRTVSVIGDGGFMHGGFNSLLNAKMNGGTGFFLILDNGGLAMTGGIGNPSTGRNIRGAAPVVSIESLLDAFHIRHDAVDAFDLKALRGSLDAYESAEGLHVLIVKSKCHIADNSRKYDRLTFQKDKCTGCMDCFGVNCMALSFDSEGMVLFDSNKCNNCGICVDRCKESAFLVAAGGGR